MILAEMPQDEASPGKVFFTMILQGASEIHRVSDACNLFLMAGQSTVFSSPPCQVLLSSQMHNAAGANVFLCDVYSKNDLYISRIKASQEICIVCIC